METVEIVLLVTFLILIGVWVFVYELWFLKDRQKRIEEKLDNLIKYLKIKDNFSLQRRENNLIKTIKG